MTKRDNITEHSIGKRVHDKLEQLIGDGSDFMLRGGIGTEAVLIAKIAEFVAELDKEKVKKNGVMTKRYPAELVFSGAELAMREAKFNLAARDMTWTSVVFRGASDELLLKILHSDHKQARDAAGVMREARKTMHDGELGLAIDLMREQKGTPDGPVPEESNPGKR